LGVRNVASASIGGNQQKRNARPIADQRLIRAKGTERRQNVVIVAFGIVPSHDDRAVLPIGARRDLIDGLGDHGFADLSVRIGGMVVVAQKVLLYGWIEIDRLQAKEVLKPALDEEDAALFRERLLIEGIEKVLEPVKLATHYRVIGDVAEILWPIVVRDVGRVGPIGGRRTL